MARPADLVRPAEGEPFYIVASASRVDDRTRVLKEGESFALLDRFGDIAPAGVGELGLYHEGARFLSRCSLTLNRQRPLLLSSGVAAHNGTVVVNLMNPDFPGEGPFRVHRGTIHVLREVVLWDGVCYQRIRFVNYGLERARFEVTLAVEADFADLFEVRGMRRSRRGDLEPPESTPTGMRLRYRGRDGIERVTEVCCDPEPSFVAPPGFGFDLMLEPREVSVLVVSIACELGPRRPAVLAFGDASARAVGSMRELARHGCTIETSHGEFDEWIRRSLADLHLLITPTPDGLYPYAGVPWFSTPFGRDGLITAFEMLWASPHVARGVLSFLAATQADATDPVRDAEPGKILHESRRGEMAALGEVPFGRYYGSVDATPLFVWLAGAYLQRTGDTAFVRHLWPAIQRALEWIDRYGDADGDGFVEYHRMRDTGLIHQGWKDSGDAVFHADGRPAEGPIALAEVQGYVYAARLAGARLALALGLPDAALASRRMAERLRRRFDEAFWSEELGTYALALDGAKEPCRVSTSNAGHCLFAGIALPERARRVAASLLSEDLFSGWGVRTVGRGSALYNPMSYHNGSVWPHDNAVVAAGLARYGGRQGAAQILAAMFDAARFVEVYRLPELFCGFDRRAGQGPTLYPVACAPQAWAAAAPFLLLQACLGLTVSARRRRVAFSRPWLPDFLRRVSIRGLAVGDGEVDLVVERHAHDVGVRVERRSGGVNVRVLS